MRTKVVLALAASAMMLLAGCSDDDDPTEPSTDTPYRLTAPLENAVVDVPLTANQPNPIMLTVQLPPDIGRVTSAEIDIAGTLDHVRIDGIPLWTLIARKVARLFGKAEEIGATATLRVGSAPETVCESGILYGPFEVSHDTELVVEPESQAADGATLEIINMGTMVVCLTVVPNIDALLSVDAVALDIAEGNCEATGNFDGTWTGTYECGDSCGEPYGGPIQLVVSQDGTEATYTDSGGDTFAGVICGDMFRFEYVGDGFAERGTLTLTGPNTAIKRSTWRGVAPPYCGGDCYDTLTRQIGGECPAIVITSGEPPAGTVGQSYVFQATAAGGQGTVTIWAIPTTEIPGLAHGENGVLSGMPTAEAVGQWDVQVTAYDQCEPEAQVVNQMYTLTIGQ